MSDMFTPNGEQSFVVAQANLSRFALAQAAAWERLLGFGWQPRPDGPSQFQALKQAFLTSQLTGRPLPISDAFSDDTIYLSASDNYAARYVHDLTHLALDEGFDRDGEIAVATAQLAVLTAFGWGIGTVEYQLLYTDTIGQTLCKTTLGQFPKSQSCFIRRAVSTSLGTAIRSEQTSSNVTIEPGHNGTSNKTKRNGQRVPA